MKLNVAAHKKTLLVNTVMLYLLRFSTYFFAFIAIPYQTRVLGPESYGKIVIASALMVYFQFIIDFGFFLSGTEQTARHRNDLDKVKQIFSSVIYGKLLLILGSAVALAIIVEAVPSYRTDPLFYAAFFLYTAFDMLLPDFVYRGMEKMAPLMYRAVSVRFFALVMLIIFVRRPDQYILIPVIELVGSALAFAWSMWDLRRRFQVWFVKVSFRQIFASIKGSSLFFLSRIAGTLYAETSTLLLGWVDPTRISSARFGLSMKLVTTGASALAPISDSIYPYMVVNKDFRLVKKVMLLVEPVVIVFCLVVGFFANDFCALLFGAEYRSVGPILVAMLPAAVFVFPDYIFGFPCLSALGATKHANYSIFVSGGLHIVNVSVFYLMGWLNPVSLAALFSVAYGVETFYRIIVVAIKYRQYKRTIVAAPSGGQAPAPQN